MDKNHKAKIERTSGLKLIIFARLDPLINVSTTPEQSRGEHIIAISQQKVARANMILP